MPNGHSVGPAPVAPGARQEPAAPHARLSRAQPCLVTSDLADASGTSGQKCSESSGTALQLQYNSRPLALTGGGGHADLYRACCPCLALVCRPSPAHASRLAPSSRREQWSVLANGMPQPQAPPAIRPISCVKLDPLASSLKGGGGRLVGGGEGGGGQHLPLHTKPAIILHGGAGSIGQG